jgi:protein-S-isoprenylcysteine O-methyltransferase Ste14
MAKKMTAMGTGPATAVPAFAYLALVIVLDYFLRPRFKMHASFEALLPWGIALILVGLVALGVSAVQMLRAFKRHELATTGLYGISPNPMFMSYVLFVLPGLSLLLRSWPVLTSSVVFYVLIRIMSRPEEEWLKQEFGERYLEYRRRVLLKFL